MVVVVVTRRGRRRRIHPWLLGEAPCGRCRGPGQMHVRRMAVAESNVGARRVAPRAGPGGKRGEA